MKVFSNVRKLLFSDSSSHSLIVVFRWIFVKKDVGRSWEYLNASELVQLSRKYLKKKALIVEMYCDALNRVLTYKIHLI